METTKEYTYARSKTGDSKLHNLLFDRKNEPYQLLKKFNETKYSEAKNELWDTMQKRMNEIRNEFYRKAQIDSLVALTDSATYQQIRLVGLFE